jgi:hypothetical protein
VVEDTQKAGFRQVHVIEEIADLDGLFGWRYSEAAQPLHPFKLEPPRVAQKHRKLLEEWDSVWASVWDSVRASVWAYIGSLFPAIPEWRHIKHEVGAYPFQAAVDLWRMGLVPSYDGKKWRLHGGPRGEVLWEGVPR